MSMYGYGTLAKCDFLNRAAHQLALEDEENSAAWMQAQDKLQPMQDTIERIYGDAQVQLGIRAPMPETGTVAPGAAKVRVPHNLKPWELSASGTPSEFRRWQRKYYDESASLVGEIVVYGNRREEKS